MNNEEFIKAVKTDTATAALLTEIADEVRGGPAPKTYLEVGTVDLLWGAAAYAVWSLVKIGADYLRGKTALQLTADKVQLMKEIMTKYGLGLKQAKDIIDVSLAEITKRSADDPLLQKMQSLVASKEGKTD